jgi:nucleotide-binding universal stress UspA family protein
VATTVESKPVVVGIDGSEESRKALRWAARQAELTGAPLQALTAWEVPTIYGWPTYEDVDLEKQARKRVEDTVRDTLGDRPVEVTVVRGHPAGALVQASRNASLLVVGRRGHSELSELLIGSVSQHCVHHAHCPVVVVRGE